MTEEDMKKVEASLREEIEILRFTLGLIVTTLPENHRDYVVARVNERARLTRELADTKNTDPLRDQAEAAYDFAQDLERRLDGELDAFANRTEFYGIP